MKKNIMVLGTASLVGKSTIVTALCRYLKKKELDVAPFGPINISLSSSMTKNGMEIGRAQFVQAEACEIEPNEMMNPVLIKPDSNNKTKILVNGKAYCTMAKFDYSELNNDLKHFLEESYNYLDKNHDYIVLDGSGSCAEIDSREKDITNMQMAKMSNSDVILVADTERGGVFASIYGTIMLLEEDERKLIKGIIINKSNTNKEDFEIGIKKIEEITNIPVLGVMPYIELNIEDEKVVSERLKKNQKNTLNVSIIKLPHMSNITDFYPFELEKNVNIRLVENKDELKDSDIIILPGTKNTMHDLRAIKKCGIYDEIINLNKKGTTIMGICGGFQMLGKEIIDSYGVEDSRDSVELGFNLLPLTTTFSYNKKTVITKGQVCNLENDLNSLSKVKVYGYEIHNGESSMDGDVIPFIIDSNNNILGLCNKEGNVIGTYIHGIFEGAEFRHKLFNVLKGKYGVVVDDKIKARENYLKYKLSQYDKLEKIFRENIDTKKLDEILELQQNKEEV